MIHPLNWLLSTSDGRPLCFPCLRALSILQNFLNHHCTVYSLAVPGPNVLLMLQIVSAALQPILKLNKKIAQICFLSYQNFPSLKYIYNTQQVISHQQKSIKQEMCIKII